MRRSTANPCRSALAWLLACGCGGGVIDVHVDPIDSDIGAPTVLSTQGTPGATDLGTFATRVSRLRVSSNRRYLVGGDGKPVFLRGDTAWAMPENASREDVDDYLADRHSRGFNYIQIVAARDLGSESLDATIASRTMNPKNRNGHRPFKWSAGGKADIAKPIVVAGGSPEAPNDYWDHLEYIIRAARDAGMVVGMLPVWGKYYINNSNPDLRLFTDSTAEAYGYFLAERYQSYTNIIWILGGDAPADKHVDARSIYRSLAEGIVAGATGLAPAWDQPHSAWQRVLLTAHLCPPTDGNADIFDADPWMSIKMVISDEGDLYGDTVAARSTTPVRPVLIGESRYEGWIWDKTYKSARLVRRQAYHSYFAGALAGYVYGSAMSAAEAHDQMFRFRDGWRDRMDLPGVQAMQHFGDAITGRRWWRRVSSQDLIDAPRGTGVELKAAARSASGNELLVYFPFSSAGTVHLDAITTHPRVKATWFNPRDGGTSEGGVFLASAAKEFHPPVSWEDALLILEGTNEALKAPTPLTPDFRTVDGEVVLAAEAFSSWGGSIGSWSEETTDSGYLGSGYLRSGAADPQLHFDLDIAHLNYLIRFEQAGTYYVHLRTLAADHSENGFFATLNGEEVSYGGANPADPAQTAYYIYVKKSGAWSWYTDGGGAEARELEVSFAIPSPGQYTFSLYRRDTGSRLDHIWLTQHHSAPQQGGTISLPDPSLFLVD